MSNDPTEDEQLEIRQRKLAMTPRYLTIDAKCSDLCYYRIEDETNKLIVEQDDGYVPDGLGIGGGDYVQFTIDLETGTIVGWTPPETKALQAAIKQTWGDYEDDDDDKDDDC